MLNLNEAAKEGKRVVVIGSSFISMELVAAFRNRKLASIDVIGMEEVPFERILGKEVGAALGKVGLSPNPPGAITVDLNSIASRIQGSQVPHED